MRKLHFISILLIGLFQLPFKAASRGSDSLHIYKNIDTTFIENYRDWLSAKLIAVVRTNTFSIKDNLTQRTLEYSINTNVNMGLGLSFKGINFEFQYNPPGLNNDDYKYGKSKQLAFATSANGRRFIYDVFYRYNQGYHTTTAYKTMQDTTVIYKNIYRADIRNTNAGLNFVYVFNNKHFSSAAPYNLTQRQKRGAGSTLLGTFFSVYSIDADSVIFPDSLKAHFKPEVQFKNASSLTWGVSYGYTYTFVFFRHWFANIYTLPGLSVQQYTSTNAYNTQHHSNVALGLSLQTRFSIGFNRKTYFIGISWINNSYLVDNDKKSSLNYKYGAFRFYYGHRFDLRRVLKKHL